MYQDVIINSSVAYFNGEYKHQPEKSQESIQKGDYMEGLRTSAVPLKFSRIT